MTKASVALFIGLVGLLGCQAGAAETVDQPAAAQTTEEKAVEAYGGDNENCRAWTDGCVICSRGTEAAACSTPGIACQPHAVRCTAETVAPK